MIFTIFNNSKREFTLCDSCLYSHVVLNGGEKRFTGCFVGGELREIKFAVTECSTYFDRSRRRISNSIEGFVRKAELETETRELVEK
jgi:hypothetical protein